MTITNLRLIMCVCFDPDLCSLNFQVIPNYSSKEKYDKLFALGVTMYGQMTAGSYCYIGPQGIVHGTTLTVLNAARRHLNTSDLAGRVFVTSGLGGMSGAQAKAATICGCVGVIAEVGDQRLEYCKVHTHRYSLWRDPVVRKPLVLMALSSNCSYLLFYSNKFALFFGRYSSD